jgi:small subunit ribosomal protein S15
MSTAKETKEKLVTDFQLHQNDTGSSQVQIALLTQRITE